MLKQMVSKNFSGSFIQGIARKLVHSEEVEEQFPHILKLLTLAPLSSIECEKGFSKQNLIKTKL